MPDDILKDIESEIIDSTEAAEAFRVKYLGRKSGIIPELFKRIPEAPPQERKALGQRINQIKKRAEERLATFEASHALRSVASETAHMDRTLPGRLPASPGSLHPLTHTLHDIARVFEQFGFSIVTGPEIETEWHNFTALNFPADHPARDMQDTFFLEPDRVLLRTHTSPVQIRTLLTDPPPVRVIVPGRVYRNEAVSYKSYCLFHQVEGLYVDEGVSFADLKQVLRLFVQALFGDDVRMRFRPSFFPFTEPSAEVDIWWADHDRSSKSQPRQGRWLEILGCGMVDPNVFAAVDLDPERWTGYAFGMGIERIAMLRYGIRDIRTFYENDIRFLKQF